MFTNFARELYPHYIILDGVDDTKSVHDPELSMRCFLGKYEYAI